MGFVIGLLAWLNTDMPAGAAFFILPWMTLDGALCGGAMEWQLPDESDAVAKPSTGPDTAAPNVDLDQH